MSRATLLRCITLLEPIDAGRILLDGGENAARGADVNRILEEGAPGRIFRDPAEPPTRQFLDRVIVAGRL